MRLHIPQRPIFEERCHSSLSSTIALKSTLRWSLLSFNCVLTNVQSSHIWYFSNEFVKIRFRLSLARRTIKCLSSVYGLWHGSKPSSASLPASSSKQSLSLTCNTQSQSDASVESPKYRDPVWKWSMPREGPNR